MRVWYPSNGTTGTIKTPVDGGKKSVVNRRCVPSPRPVHRMQTDIGDEFNSKLKNHQRRSERAVDGRHERRRRDVWTVVYCDYNYLFDRILVLPRLQGSVLMVRVRVSHLRFLELKELFIGFFCRGFRLCCLRKHFSWSREATLLVTIVANDGSPRSGSSPGP